MFKHITLISIAYFILVSCFSGVAHAAEFDSTYDYTYTVQPDGRTRILAEISLTNLVTNIYATQFSVVIKNAHIENVAGKDAIGPLSVTTVRLGDETKVTAVFNDKVVGKGSKQNFTISYETMDIAEKAGKIWEITLPKAQIDDSVKRYTVTLRIPPQFGQPMYLKPEPVSSVNNQYVWNFDQVKKSIINVAFGKSQLFAFKIQYHLQNSGSSAADQVIALPPDTTYQQVQFTKIDPMPVDTEIDGDGNLLALFTVPAKEKYDIVATGVVEIFSSPREEARNLGKPTPNLLKATNFWQSDDPKIQKIAKQLSGPYDIYSFVTKQLKYDYSRVTANAKRLGALSALEKPEQAICTEFTDLSIALLRAKRIFAREINGYAYTSNAELRPLAKVVDVLHAWPEYYDENNGWTPMDPTWGNTTGGVDYFHSFDANHIALAIHGESSEIPAPAGSYKTGDTMQQKDIDIRFVDTKPAIETRNPIINVYLPSILVRQENISIEISNPNNHTLYNIPLAVQGDQIQTQALAEKTIIMAPWEKRTLTASIKPSSLAVLTTGKLTVTVGDTQRVYTVKTSPFASLLIIAIFGIICTVLIIAYLTQKRGKKR